MEFQRPQWVERVTSTNTALLERLHSGQRLADGHVLAADEQTAGRGRGERRWQSQPGRDLACSFVLRAAVEPQRLCSLSMAVALGVADCLDGYGVRGRTKWPNDVVAAGRKIAGILPEVAPAGRRARSTPAVVVGVGANVGMSAAEAAAIDQPATSVFIETGSAPSPRELLPALLTALAPRLDAWRQGGFAALRVPWEQRCVGVGRTVTVVDGERRRRGVLAGFGDAGQLQLDEGDGVVAQVWAGHLLLDRERG